MTFQLSWHRIKHSSHTKHPQKQPIYWKKKEREKERKKVQRVAEISKTQQNRQPTKQQNKVEPKYASLKPFR